VQAFITINTDGLISLLLSLLLYGVVLLVLAGFALKLIITGKHEKRWFGALLLVALGAYGFGPTYLAQYQSDRHAVRIAAVSFWPEDVSFADGNVLLLTDSVFGCDNLCENLFSRSGAVSVHIWDIDDADIPIEGDIDFLRDPNHNVSRVYQEITSTGYSIIRTTEDVLPAHIDWIVLRDDGVRYSREHASAFGIARSDAKKLRAALHVFRVEQALDGGEAVMVPVARMFVGTRTTIPWFLPMAGSKSYSSSTAVFSNALETWICGPIIADAEDRCRYMF
jgi:hypothetical protein